MELLDVVDINDNVIGSATREECYDKLLCHRIVHILIFDKEGKMVLQKRSSNVSFCPDHWSTAVGGHVLSGETYRQGASREYFEELGATSEIELVGKDFYDMPGIPNKFLATFKTVFDGPFNLDYASVSRLASFGINEIEAMIESGEKFHPELLFILNRYFLP